MSESNLLYPEGEYPVKNTYDDIREVVQKMVKQVENMSCSKSTNEAEITSSVSIDESDETCLKSGQANNLKRASEISVDRPKHRNGSKKSRSRRRKHKWKPYHKLTSDERRRLEERTSRRANRSRQKMSASGLTLAPYNTTQFLMDDHNIQEPDYEISHHDGKHKGDYGSSDDNYSSSDDTREFMQQQFSEEYDTQYDASRNDMSKYDLVPEVIRLEDEIESLEQTLRDSWEEKKSELDVEAEMEKIRVFQVEIEKLTHENHLLAKRHEMLQNQLLKSKDK